MYWKVRSVGNISVKWLYHGNLCILVMNGRASCVLVAICTSHAQMPNETCLYAAIWVM